MGVEYKRSSRIGAQAHKRKAAANTTGGETVDFTDKVTDKAHDKVGVRSPALHAPIAHPCHQPITSRVD